LGIPCRPNSRAAPTDEDSKNRPGSDPDPLWLIHFELYGLFKYSLKCQEISVVGSRVVLPAMYEHDDDGVLLGGDPTFDPDPDSLQLGAGIAAALIVNSTASSYIPKSKRPCGAWCAAFGTIPSVSRGVTDAKAQSALVSGRAA
jgi:hypothetical protein